MIHFKEQPNYNKDIIFKVNFTLKERDFNSSPTVKNLFDLSAITLVVTKVFRGRVD